MYLLDLVLSCSFTFASLILLRALLSDLLFALLAKVLEHPSGTLVDVEKKRAEQGPCVTRGSDSSLYCSFLGFIHLTLSSSVREVLGI